MLHHDTCGDHLHEISYSRDNEQFERIAHFDFDQIDRNLGYEPEPEKAVEMSDVAAALAIILQWICGTPNLTNAGARAASLLAFLDPTNAPHGRETMADIAVEAGCTRAYLSKALLDLRDQTGIALTMGKLGSTRQTYAKAQKAAFNAGCHSGATRKDSVKPRKQAEQISLEAVAD
jgi:hypothetical protein